MSDGIGFDVDAMTPDELRRRVRDLMRENEALRKRLENGTRLDMGDGRWAVIATEYRGVPKATP